MSTPREFFLADGVELLVDRNSFEHPVQMIMKFGLHDHNSDDHRCFVSGSLSPGQVDELIRELIYIRDRLAKGDGDV